MPQVKNTLLREHICHLRQENPCLTLREIGSKVGLSRERVRQILEDELLPTKAIRPLKYGLVACVNCGVAFRQGGHKRNCCSLACHKAQHRVTLTCDWCGRLFTRLQSEVLYQSNRKPNRKWFCRRRCLGFYVAKHFGFWAHPENTKLRKGKKDEYCKSGRHLMAENAYVWTWKGKEERRCRICLNEYQRRRYCEKKASMGAANLVPRSHLSPARTPATTSVLSRCKRLSTFVRLACSLWSI